MRQSHTAVIERNAEWSGAISTEPYETAWAGEAIFFVRLLDSDRLSAPLALTVQISPDGMRWCDEGTALHLFPGQALSFCRVSHFGGWLRLVGQLPEEETIDVIVYLQLKE